MISCSRSRSSWTLLAQLIDVLFTMTLYYTFIARPNFGKRVPYCANICAQG